MASSSKRKTTMAKLNRERRLLERRQEKQARKAARKAAAADAQLTPDQVTPDPVAQEQVAPERSPRTRTRRMPSFRRRTGSSDLGVGAASRRWPRRGRRAHRGERMRSVVTTSSGP